MSKDLLPATVRHGYGLGALSLAIANTAVLFFLLKFLVDVAHLPPAWAGTVLLVGKIWDAVIDPVVGHLVDATDSRMGARRPWILGGTIPFALLFALLWWGLPLEGLAAGVVYAFLLMAYNTAYTAVVLPYGALTPALTRDYDERTRLNGARMGWSMIGGIVAGVAMPMLIRSASWRTAGMALALCIVPPLLVTLWATAGRDQTALPAAGGPSMWSVLRLASFRRVAMLFTIAWSSIAALSALLPFYVQHHLRHPELLDPAFAAIQLSALASIPGIVWLAARVEKHVAYAGTVAVWAAVLLGLSLVPEGTGWIALAVCALVGPGVAAAHVLPWSMLPDVVEVDAAGSGVERAGAFYGMMTFIEQCATAVVLWLLGIGLQLGGYVEGAPEQAESARLAIRVLVGPVPGVLLLGAAVLALALPPITRETHRALVAQLRRS